MSPLELSTRFSSVPPKIQVSIQNALENIPNADIYSPWLKKILNLNVPECLKIIRFSELQSELVLFVSENFSPPLEHAMYDILPPPPQ